MAETGFHNMSSQLPKITTMLYNILQGPKESLRKRHYKLEFIIRTSLMQTNQPKKSIYIHSNVQMHISACAGCSVQAKAERAHCLTSVGHCGYLCSASITWPCSSISRISWYSRWTLHAPESTGRTSSSCSRCSNAWNTHTHTNTHTNTQTRVSTRNILNNVVIVKLSFNLVKVS